MKKRNLNGSDISFERDEWIEFNEALHTYTVKGHGLMTPVSTVISHFFEPFNAEHWSLRKCGGDPIAAARLREEWAAKGAKASQAGTYLHKIIEEFINDGCEPESLSCQVRYEGKYVSMRESVNVAHEWNLFQEFHKAIGYNPFRTEWCVFDEDARIAGTIDLLCQTADGNYEIFDWKRSNKIDPSETNRWNKGMHGLEYMDDTTFNHYCLQQNLYRHILESKYGLRVKKMTLVVLHPDLTSYRLINVPEKLNAVKAILEYMKLQNRE